MRLFGGASTNDDKVFASQGDWPIGFATPGLVQRQLPSLQTVPDVQRRNDCRLQIAANIIDYIDTDTMPTDLGNYPDIGTTAQNPATPVYPIIGIEKIPYLVEVDVIYTAAGAYSWPGNDWDEISF